MPIASPPEVTASKGATLSPPRMSSIVTPDSVSLISYRQIVWRSRTRHLARLAHHPSPQPADDAVEQAKFTIVQVDTKSVERPVRQESQEKRAAWRQSWDAGALAEERAAPGNPAWGRGSGGPQRDSWQYQAAEDAKRLRKDSKSGPPRIRTEDQPVMLPTAAFAAPQPPARQAAPGCTGDEFVGWTIPSPCGV